MHQLQATSRHTKGKQSEVSTRRTGNSVLTNVVSISTTLHGPEDSTVIKEEEADTPQILPRLSLRRFPRFKDSSALVNALSHAKLNEIVERARSRATASPSPFIQPRPKASSALVSALAELNKIQGSVIAEDDQPAQTQASVPEWWNGIISC